MSARASLRVAIAIVACAVLLRAFPFVWWPNTHFDSDQAVVGLMAKHLAEGRALPLFFYGQHYMLAVEAWLAAPLFWLFGASVAALKLPLLTLVTLAVVAPLLHMLNRALERPASMARDVASLVAAFARGASVISLPVRRGHRRQRTSEGCPRPRIARRSE